MLADCCSDVPPSAMVMPCAATLAFRRTLAAELKPWAERFGRRVNVYELTFAIRFNRLESTGRMGDDDITSIVVR